MARITCLAVTVGFFLFASSTAFSQGNSEQGLLRALAAQIAHTDRLLQLKGVVGTAVGEDDAGVPVIKVLVAHPGATPGLAGRLDGVPVIAEVTGEIVAFKPPGNQGKPGGSTTSPTSRFDRPVPIGVSTGNIGECSAGTIGCRVTDGANVYILSNNHVLALQNYASLGSHILQPGRYDTSCASDLGNSVGTLTARVPIIFSTSANNVVDAAIALSTVDDVGKATPSNGYGTPSSVIQENLSFNLAVKKYGRTTSLTTGKITGINATVNVGYDRGTARFVNQIIIQGSKGSFSKPGDSGSLIVTSSGNSPVGLLFAGSSTITVANPIGAVLDAFDVTIDGN